MEEYLPGPGPGQPAVTVQPGPRHAGVATPSLLDVHKASGQQCADLARQLHAQSSENAVLLGRMQPGCPRGTGSGPRCWTPRALGKAGHRGGGTGFPMTQRGHKPPQRRSQLCGDKFMSQVKGPLEGAQHTAASAGHPRDRTQAVWHGPRGPPTRRNDADPQRAGHQSCPGLAGVHAGEPLCPADQAVQDLTEHAVPTDTHDPAGGMGTHEDPGHRSGWHPPRLLHSWGPGMCAHPVAAALPRHSVPRPALPSPSISIPALPGGPSKPLMVAGGRAPGGVRAGRRPSPRFPRTPLVGENATSSRPTAGSLPSGQDTK